MKGGIKTFASGWRRIGSGGKVVKDELTGPVGDSPDGVDEKMPLDEADGR